MKTLFKSMMIIAAAAMAFSACNKAEVEAPQNEEDFYFTFILGNPETRSLLSSDENGKFGAWENGDRLGTAIDDADPGYAYVTTTTTPTTFKIYKKGGLSGGETIYAYYPYNSAAESISAIPFEIPANQSQSGADFDFDAMPMVADAFVVPEEYASTNDNTEVGEISLVNLGSVIDFQVYSSNTTYAEETILSVKLAASSPVAGSFTKDITSVQVNSESSLSISGYTETDVLTTVTNAPAVGADRASSAHIYMVVAPATGVTGSVVVTTNKAKYTYNLSSAQTFKRAGLKSFGLNLGTCQNRVAEEIKTATFVFNTVDGIKALDINLPGDGQATEVPRAQTNAIVLTGALGTNSSNIPRVWNNSGKYNFRVMKGNTLSFAVTEGGTIKNVVFDAGERFNLTVEDGDLSGTTWSGAASSVTFTNTDADRTDINTITVSYTGGVEPTALEMSDITCTNSEQNETSLTFSWNAVSNASGYRVSTDGGETYSDSQTETSFTWTNLDPDTEFTLYVKAISTNALYLNSAPKSQSGKTKASSSTGVEWVKTAITDLVTGDVIAIVDVTSSRAMSNNNGTGSAPSATPVNISSDKSKLTVAPDANLQWIITCDNNSYKFQVAGTKNYLYSTNSNNGVRVGTNETNSFTFEQNFLKHTGTSRWIGVYSNQDWRGYANEAGPTSASNIKNTVTYFYKKVGTEPATTYSVSVASDIQNGSVIASKTSDIAENESVTLTISADDGYELATLTVDGSNVTSSVSNNQYTFSMPAHDVTVSATFKEEGGEPNVLYLTNDEIVTALSNSGQTTNNYGDLTITSDSGEWNANVSKQNTLTYLQLRAKSGSMLASPIFGSSISKVVITPNKAKQTQSRTIHLIPSGTSIPSGDYSSELWENQYGSVATGTTGADVTIDFSESATSFILVVEGGATYIDALAIYFN